MDLRLCRTPDGFLDGADLFKRELRGVRMVALCGRFSEEPRL